MRLADPDPSFEQARPVLSKRLPPSLGNKARRGLWQIVYYLFFRFSPVPFHGWRRFLLCSFGARLGRHPSIYPSAKIWAPWNLIVGNAVTVGPGADLYNVAPITLGDDVIISQGAYLCSASHDHGSADFALITGRIVIEANAWVAAQAFIAPGMTVGQSAVVGARAVVTRNVEAYAIVTGNPAKVSGTRPADARNVLGTR